MILTNGSLNSSAGGFGGKQGWEARTYIMNTFKCGDHGVYVAGAFDAPIDSTIGHFSKHLEETLVSVGHIIAVGAKNTF